LMMHNLRRKGLTAEQLAKVSDILKRAIEEVEAI
jgi:hypothetical protein